MKYAVVVPPLGCFYERGPSARLMLHTSDF